MSDDPKCVAGCVPFYGGEKRHHKDCPYYPESLTKLNADRIEELEAKLAKALGALVRIADTPSEMTWGVDSEVREAMNGMEIIAETTIAELTSSEAANGEAKGGKDE